MDPQDSPPKPHQVQAQRQAINQVDTKLQSRPDREVDYNNHPRQSCLTNHTQGESNLNPKHNQGKQLRKKLPSSPVRQNHDQGQISQELQQNIERRNKGPHFEEQLPQARRESQADNDIDEEELCALEKQIENEYKLFQKERKAA
ncbi:ab147add-e177-4ac7-bfa8-f46b31f5e10b [Sclerotinia trifoliorum]|uniref:Ab147add-e177-4ac7-bfa8-f46b31f5e10b n=1 Tax=Sclerotinia trifoliorum TaxID=28548 RepID=A0A8H2VRU7_9HELO|nr:ab147add-e177-4ac7-bfa8-f46b31f5e10b [Sclerotinia trifoliorum]